MQQAQVTPPNIKSAKWFWWWVLRRLSSEQLRCVLSGLRADDGNESPQSAQGGCIYTACVRMRDEIVRAAILAGYSVSFSERTEPGTAVGRVNRQGVTIITRERLWQVMYTADIRMARPVIDIRKEMAWDGTRQELVWCVKAPTPEHLIIARRVVRKEKGVVMEAASPVVIGNSEALDVLEIMRNIHIFVSRYNYNMNTQIFIERAFDQKHLASINIYHISDSLRTHGTGIMNCFPVSDHEVLTDRGFMSHSVITAHLAVHGKVGLACAVNGGIEYRPIDATSLVFKEGEFRCIRMHAPKHHLDLLPTDNHRMWVRSGDDQAFGIVSAGDLHQRAAPVQFECRFDHGFTQVDLEPFFVRDLDLLTADEVDAFLELYGYWLGDGWLSVDRAAVAFGPANPHDWTYLEGLFARLGIQRVEVGSRGAAGYWRGQQGERVESADDDAGESSSSSSSARPQRPYHLMVPKWWSFFAAEYGHKYSGTHAADAEPLKSAKWMASWVWRLSPLHAQSLLRGLRFADGNQAVDDASQWRISTSSARFRDEIQRLCLHAGYTTSMAIHMLKGDRCGVNAQGIDIIASTDAYVVFYTASVDVGQPSVDTATFTEERVVEPVWCVQAPTAQQLIVVRRVTERDDEGRVRLASRPTVTGNTTVNFTYQFLIRKFKIFSEFLFDDHIKSRLIKQIRYFRQEKERLHQRYPYEIADKFLKDIRKLGVAEDGTTFLDQFRKQITEIGNALGYVRMVRSGGLHHVSASIKFVPDLEAIPPFLENTTKENLSPETKEAAKNLDGVIQDLLQNFAEGSEYFQVLVKIFQPVLNNEAQTHLKNFYAIGE
jgi:hypothetical protein